MKTVQINLNLFDFNELNDEAKAKAKNFYLNINSDVMQEDYATYCEYVLKDEYGFKKCPKMAYSLSFQQGDGMCFYGQFYASDFNDKFFKNVLEKGMTKRQKEITEEKLQKVNFDKTNHFYAHAHTVDIELVFDNENYRHFNTFNIAKKNIENWYINICKRFEEAGYKFFYEIEDDDMMEFFQLNEIMFKENGEAVYINNIKP